MRHFSSFFISSSISLYSSLIDKNKKKKKGKRKEQSSKSERKRNMENIEKLIWKKNSQSIEKNMLFCLKAVKNIHITRNSLH